MKSVRIRNFYGPYFLVSEIEYADLQSKSPYLVEMQENTNRKNLANFIDPNNCRL